MKHPFTLIITLFQLLGFSGLPVAAYSCFDCGERGLVSYLSPVAAACYAETCCDGETPSATGYLESSLPCCDMEVPGVLDSGGVLVPDPKSAPAGLAPPDRAAIAFAASNTRPVVAGVYAPAFRPGINPPLLI